MASAQGNEGPRRRFAVIARRRPGAFCTVSATQIGMDIIGQLAQFQIGFDVSYYPEGFFFLIETASAAFQLQLLGRQTLQAEGVDLELVPWCFEYEFCDLPWIDGHHPEAVSSVGPMKPYMNNMVGQPKPLLKFVSGLLDGCTREDLKSGQPDHLEVRRIYVDAVPTQGIATVLDLSYMLILELRDFYYEKYDAFVKCRSSCRQVYDVAHQFYMDLKLGLERICDAAQLLQHVLGEQGLSDIVVFAERVSLLSKYAAKELVDTGDVLCPVLREARSPISLSKFKDGPSIYQATGLGYPTVHLRAILDVISHKFYDISLSVSTRAAADGTFYTTIKGGEFKDKYKAAKTMTQFEAEAVAICKFVRHVTNVLGYSVVDQNQPVLARLVFDMNMFTKQLAALQICVGKAGRMVYHGHKRIRDVFEILKPQIPPQHIQVLNNSVDEVLASIKEHYATMYHAITAYKQYEELYMGLKLKSRYGKLSASTSVNN